MRRTFVLAICCPVLLWLTTPSLAQTGAVELRQVISREHPAIKGTGQGLALGRDGFEQRGELVAFAAEPDDEHAACVGMLRERRKQPARMAEVVAELRTAEGVLEGVDAVDAPGVALARDPCDAGGEIADAADGGQDPDLVARADAAVGAAIAGEAARGGEGRDALGFVRRVAIVAFAAERGRDVEEPFVVLGGLPDEERHPAAGSKCPRQVAKGCDRVAEEDRPGLADDAVGRARLERIDLRVTQGESQVGEAGPLGSLPGLVDQVPGEVDAEHGSVRRRRSGCPGGVAAAAAHVDDPRRPGQPGGLEHAPVVAARGLLEQIGVALREVAQFGARYGVQIRLEVHGRGTSELPNIQRIMESCDHENAVVCWNCNEADLAGRGLEHNFRIVMKWIGIYHIHDLTSDYPWQELFSYAKKSGFDGWMLLEEGQPTGDPIRVMKYYRMLWERMVA